jgi:MATE family multidrug resistance protein
VSILRNSLSCYFSGIGRTKIVMTATLVAMVVNVGLDYVLIFGKMGFCHGDQGAALAVLGATCGPCIDRGICGKKNWHEYHVAAHSIRQDSYHKLLYYGYPAGLELFLNFLAFTTMIFLFHSHGNVVATASTIMFNWDLVSFIPCWELKSHQSGWRI